MNSIFRKMGLTAALLGVTASFASAQVLYDANSFEATGGPPNWNLGLVNGQNSWFVSGTNSGPSHTVVGTVNLGDITITPFQGSQMVQSVSSDSTAGNNRRIRVNLASQYNARTSGNNTILLELQTFVPANQSAVGDAFGLQTFGSFDSETTAFQGVLAIVPLDQEVDVFGATSGFFGTGSYNYNAWNKLTLVLDYDTNAVEGYLNDSIYGGLGSDGTLFKREVLNTNGPFPLTDAIISTYNFDTTTNGTFFSDNFKVTAVKSATFAAGTTVEGVDDISSASKFIVVGLELRNADGSARPRDNFDVLKEDAGQASRGLFSVRFHDVPDGSYLLAIKGERSVSRLLNVTVTNGVATVPNTSLLGGDANGDDIVDVLDLSAIISAFDAVLDEDPNTAGNQPSANWDSGADFNYDGFVDVLDLAILISNFDLTGEASL